MEADGPFLFCLYRKVVVEGTVPSTSMERDSDGIQCKNCGGLVEETVDSCVHYTASFSVAAVTDQMRGYEN